MSIQISHIPAGDDFASKSTVIGSFAYPTLAEFGGDEGVHADACSDQEQQVWQGAGEALAENGILFDEVRLSEFTPGEIRVYGARLSGEDPALDAELQQIALAEVAPQDEEWRCEPR